MRHPRKIDVNSFSHIRPSHNADVHNTVSRNFCTLGSAVGTQVGSVMTSQCLWLQHKMGPRLFTRGQPSPALDRSAFAPTGDKNCSTCTAAAHLHIRRVVECTAGNEDDIIDIHKTCHNTHKLFGTTCPSSACRGGTCMYACGITMHTTL